jgi:hypothetical protein
MTHDSEQLAAVWLGGGMRRRARLRYEIHLLDCEACWHEVTQARRGRSLAEGVRDVAPPALREGIRTAIATIAAGNRAQQVPLFTHRRTVAAITTVAVVTVALLGALRPWDSSQGPSDHGVSGEPVLADVVASYRNAQLPGTAIPGHSAPDLSRVGLQLVGAAAGRFDGAAISGFAYRDVVGDRVTLYIGSTSFEEATDAHELAGPEGAWTAVVGGVNILCSRGKHAMLILGTDPTTVHRVATFLDVT